MEIKLSDARKIILHAQKLAHTGESKGQVSSLEVIQSLGHVQIDTISVVQRAHHHIIWARNFNYKLNELDDLVAQRRIFEYWSHAASYLPMETYRFCLPRMQQYLTTKRHWFKVDTKVKRYVLDTIKSEGPKKAGDFKRAKKNSGWFDWSPTKKALEQLFMEGTLMATRREGFHKVYDLRENVLPPHLDLRFPSDDELAQFLIFSQLKNLGLAQAEELAYQRSPHVKALVKKCLQELVEDKKLARVTLTDQKLPYYLSMAINWQKILSKKDLETQEVHILSPFDNLVIQRKRLQKLFQFNYQIECYVPEKKRKFGYFCLPVLLGDQFVARMDIKANRKIKKLEIKKVFYEDSCPAEPLNRQLKPKLQAFCQFNHCQSISWPQ